MRRVVILAAMMLALAGCLSVAPGLWTGRINDTCGNRDGRWARIEPAPVDADRYRLLANERRRWNRPPPSTEFWFGTPSGEVRLCRSNERVEFCSAEWTDFRATGTGLEVTNSPINICLGH